jgi:hypothetical protein
MAGDPLRVNLQWRHFLIIIFPMVKVLDNLGGLLILINDELIELLADGLPPIDKSV